MGFLDFLGKKDAKKEDDQKASKKAETETEGGFNEACALCGKGSTDKKWAGQYWHKKCLRSSRKMAKGMI